MLKAALLIARKDVRLILRGGAGLVQAALLGLLLVFVFSLAQSPGQVVPPTMAAAIFWLASAFCLVLAGNMCHGLEERNATRTGLLLAPTPVQGIWLGKGMAILLMLLLVQAVLIPALVAFLGQSLPRHWLEHTACLLLIDVGLAGLGSLLGALAQGQAARESLLSVVLFPLIVPVLLAGIHLGGAALTPASALPATVAAPFLTDDIRPWIGLILGFDAIFLAAGLVLFPFVCTGEE